MKKLIYIIMKLIYIIDSSILLNKKIKLGGIFFINKVWFIQNCHVIIEETLLIFFKIVNYLHR